MEITTIDPKEEKELKEQSLSLYNEVKDFVIKDDTGYALVSDYLARCRAGIKTITAKLEPQRKALQDAKDRFQDFKNEMLKPYQDGDAICTEKIQVWQLAQREKQRKAQEEADRIARIEQKRQEDELLRQAEELTAQGKDSEAQEVIEQPVYVAPIVVPSVAPKVSTSSGTVSGSFKYEAQIVDMQKFLTAVISGKVNFDLNKIKINKSDLDSIPNNQGLRKPPYPDMTSVPGLRITEIFTPSARNK